MAAMFDCTSPDSLKPGQSFSLKGTVVSIENIASITVSVVAEGGNAVISETRNPGSATFNIADVDSAMKFNALPEGVYSYQVKGSDDKGNSFTVINKKFYVTSKTGITGEVNISGYFLTLGVDTELRADAETAPQNASFAYQWYADGDRINGANSRTFRTTFAQAGKSISVRLVGTGDYIGEIESGPTPIVANFFTNRKFKLILKNETVSPAPAGTTVNQLLDGLVSEFLFNGIYDKSGKKLSGEDTLATGQTLRSMFLGMTTLRYYIVVQGDLNGDGLVSAADARLALRISAKLEEKATAAQKAAGDIDGDGTVIALDARTILRVAARLQSFPDVI